MVYIISIENRKKPKICWGPGIMEDAEEWLDIKDVLWFHDYAVLNKCEYYIVNWHK